MSRTLLCLLVCAALGCDAGTYQADAGPETDAGGGPMGVIELESERAVALVFGEETELSVRYTENGSPVSGADIRFALEGRAHDATLSALSVTTDEDGRASTRLRASSSATAFRARVSAYRAASVYVDVSVGNMGFGDLRVATVYPGSREGKRVIDIYAGIECEDERPASADRMAVFDGARHEARFGALPAGIVYTVAARLVGPTGTTLATACRDRIEIERERETRVELPLRDVPLVPGGRYALELAVDATESADEVVDLGVSAGVEWIEASSTAALYLDALEAELRSRGEVAAADMLESERLTGVPDVELTGALEIAEIDMGASLLALAGLLTERLRSLTMTGPLLLAADAAGLSGEWVPGSLELGLGLPDGLPLSLTPDALGLAASMTVEQSAASSLALTLHVSLPLGTLAGQTLDGLARVMGHASPAGLLEADAGCHVLAAWVAHTPLASSCDGDCAQAACMRALDDVAEALRDGMAASDASRDTIELDGRVSLRDEDGDAVVDRLSASDLSGLWVGPTGEPSGPLTGALSAERTVD